MYPRKAFTLIELLVVIAIILILMGMLMGGVMAVRTASIKAKAQSQLSQMVAAIDSYRSLNATYPERLPVVTTMPTFTNIPNPCADAFAAVFATGGGAAKAAGDLGDDDWRGINQALVYQLGSLANDLDPKGSGVVLDPWGNPLRYRPAKWYPFDKASPLIDTAKPPCQDTFQLWSIGKDKIDGFGEAGSDDLVNWQKN